MSSTSDPISGRILNVRGQRVILASDLAQLYGVPTFRFNEAVKRNAAKFPHDFRFQLTREEHANLISQFAISSAEAVGPRPARPNWSQIATSSKGLGTNSSQSAMRSRHGGNRKRPWAFTEHGSLMAATVLNSPRAVEMSRFVIRAFVRMREVLANNATILRRLAEIDKTLLQHDSALRTLWRKLQPLLQPPPETPAKEIGFHTRLKKL